MEIWSHWDGQKARLYTLNAFFILKWYLFSYLSHYFLTIDIPYLFLYKLQDLEFTVPPFLFL